MTSTLELIAFSRQQLLESIEGLTVEQLNMTPPGFNNNIIWNVAHVVAVLQAYLYGKNGIASTLDEAMVTDYANGTFPKDFVDQDEIDTIKELAISTAAELISDVQAGVFNVYQPSVITPKKINLATLNEALAFILYHEALHLGAVRSLKRIVTDTTYQTKAAA